MITYLKALYFMPTVAVDLWNDADPNLHAVCFWSLLGLTVSALMLHLGASPMMAKTLVFAG